ncbi:uncharacterized protein LOC116188301 [Punica granatum]|nr:uncharacterized protein LOC116188301 [Punica granatum]PKI62981.1 hypothetical protein CRG98_016620 [Punica granatum]
MGKWNHRHSRRRYKYNPQRYMYQENAYYPELDGPDSALPDNVPSWEKEFCASIGCVPWRKLLFTRKCMFGHDSVLYWDDSAGKEAFQNCKNRFWAKINDLSCEIALPDPDIYIEKVNWDSHVDPELIKEIDTAYFNPELHEGAEQKDCESSDENPWDCKRIESGEDLKCEAWSSLQRTTNINETGDSHTEDNPWEQGFTRGSEQVNWHHWRSPHVDNSNNDANPWEKGKNKQRGDPEPYSQGWNSRKSKNLYTDYANQGERGPIQERRFSNERRWRDQPKDGCRKRESFHQGGRGHESSSYRGDGRQTGHEWSQGRASKRVSFAGSRY